MFGRVADPFVTEQISSNHIPVMIRHTCQAHAPELIEIMPVILMGIHVKCMAGKSTRFADPDRVQPGAGGEAVVHVRQAVARGNHKETHVMGEHAYNINQIPAAAAGFSVTAALHPAAGQT